MVCKPVLLVIRKDGSRICNDLVLVAALGIDADSRKYPLSNWIQFTRAPKREMLNLVAFKKLAAN